MRRYTDLELLAAAHHEEIKFWRLLAATVAVVCFAFGWAIGEYETALSVNT